MLNKIDEGYIKFNCDWKNKPLQIAIPDELLKVRDKLHQLKLIGHLKKLNIGYGNISIKTNAGLIISGTQTGHIFPITKEAFTLITSYNIKENKVFCEGLVKASSETMTHAAIYETSESIKAVIHIHSKKLWNKLLYKVPTTAATIPYGTPEMANEIKRLLNENKDGELKIIAMAGHQDGLISYGNSINEAYVNLKEKF